MMRSSGAVQWQHSKVTIAVSERFVTVFLSRFASRLQFPHLAVEVIGDRRKKADPGGEIYYSPRET